MNARFTPTEEQVAVIDAARKGLQTVVVAGAGAGKTSTIRLASDTIRGKGLYLAFNKSIATDAMKKFSGHVECRTAHSLAFRAVGHAYKKRLNGPRQPAREVARLLNITHPIRLSGGRVLQPATIARLAVEAVGRFCRSVDGVPDWWHVEHFDGLDEGEDRGVRSQIVPLARRIWEDLQATDAQGGGRFRFSHDHYLKLWGDTRPELPYDFVLFDEAQDADPLVASVVQAQLAQQIVIGDPAQAIYAWRGATDALSRWPSQARLSLSQSFRFGPAIAHEANKWLGVLRAQLRIEGAGPDSTVGMCLTSDAVLCRTNGTAAAEVMRALDAGLAPALVGGGNQIVRLAEACQQLQQTGSTTHSELALFQSWGHVQEYAENESEGSDLKAFVRVIDNRGADVVIEAMNRLVSEHRADVAVSTAHKAKGREWDSVRVAGDFDPPGDDPETAEQSPIRRDEAMLAYVTVTRAKRRLDPRGLAWIDEYLAAAAPQRR